jgi:hypothetical protein
MSARITQKDLEAVCRRINRTVNGEELKAGRVVESGYQQIPNAYHLSGAYGGWSLYRNAPVDESGESLGQSDVLRCGHVPRRDLYNRMQAFLTGYETASREEE